MKQVKKLISLLLVVLMVAFSLPVAAMAADSSSYAEISGTVAEVQKYGNLTMDIKPKALYDAGYKLGDILKVTVGSNELKIPF
jgi:S-adenosylmethionine hydrolase